MTSLAKLSKLSSFSFLQTLNVESNQFGDTGLRRLLCLLENSPSLSTLLAAENGITADCFQYIAGFLGK